MQLRRGKRFAEATLAMYVRTHGLDARVVRVFNTFGPGMSLRDFRVIPQFLQSVLNNQPLRLYGDGLQTRTHLFVDDLAWERLLRHAAARDDGDAARVLVRLRAGRVEPHVLPLVVLAPDQLRHRPYPLHHDAVSDWARFKT